MELMVELRPAAAVPVRVKMPEPITAPMPRAVRLQGPSDLRRRLPGSSEARDQRVDALGAEELVQLGPDH